MYNCRRKKLILLLKSFNCLKIMSQQLDLLTENHSQWTAVSRVTPEIQKKEIKPFVLLALKEIEGNPDSRTSTLMNMEKFAAVREVVGHVARLRSATKQQWSCEDIMTFLEGLRFSPECVSEFTKLLCMDKMYDTLPSHMRTKPGVIGLQWKIDISLSQTNIQPDSSQDIKELMHRNTHIILIFALTDNRTQSYRLTISKFHELRFVIASALKNMIVLEKRKCMKKD